MRRSFTLIELMVVIGVVGIIMTFSSVNLLSLRNKASSNSMVTQLVADLKQQQMKAMIGDSSAPDDFGVRFSGNTYTLFRGTSFASSVPAENFLVTLEQDLSFPTTQDIIFKKGSGELETAASLTLANNNSGENKQIIINQFGVITEVTN